MNPLIDVFACFELNDCDAPILRAIKSPATAMEWRDADLSNRFIIGFTVDHEREVTPRDLFELSGVDVEPRR